MVRKWKHFGRFNFAEEKILNEGVIGRYSFFQFFRWIRVCRRCQASNRIRNENLTILNAKQIGIFRLYCLWSSVTTKNSVNIFTIHVRTNRFTAWHMKMHLWPSFDTINSCITHNGSVKRPNIWSVLLLLPMNLCDIYNVNVLVGFTNTNLFVVGVKLGLPYTDSFIIQICSERGQHSQTLWIL